MGDGNSGEPTIPQVPGGFVQADSGGDLEAIFKLIQGSSANTSEAKDPRYDQDAGNVDLVHTQLMAMALWDSSSSTPYTLSLPKDSESLCFSCFFPNQVE